MEERKDLTKYMVNEDKPNGESRNDDSDSWYAGSQLEALRFYLDKKVKILVDYMEDDYQGDCFAILKFGSTIVLWRDSFGSCSGCDALEGENGFEYIKLTLQEGNTRQFKSLKQAEKYLSETEDYWWQKFPKELFAHIKDKSKPEVKSLNSSH